MQKEIFEQPRAIADTLDAVDEPLAHLPIERLRPSREALDEIMESFR